MKTEITRKHYNVLFALFQTSALVDTLDDIENTSIFVKELKQKTNNYKNFLHKKVLGYLDKSYGIDSKQFEVMDRCISQNAKQFASKGFDTFFTILD